MDEFEFIASLSITVIAIAGLIWRFEARISGVESRLGERIARIEGRLESFATKADIARIEGLLEGYFLQASKREE